MTGTPPSGAAASESPGATGRVVAHATCLGCGCACDDIGVVVAGGRIVEARRACELGRAWFGDGAVPARVLSGGRDATLGDALDVAARLLVEAGRPLVYLAPDLTCEAQREAVALADLLHATIDSVSSTTVMPSLLASQERGRAGATLGEVRNRGDVVVFWGVDPALRYPRYAMRYAPDPAGTHLPDGRRSRRVVAVDVSGANGGGAESRGPADADVRVTVPAGDEVATLIALRASVTEPSDLAPVREGLAWELARQLAPTLLGARYAVLVHDAEPVAGRDPGRADALVALAQALNGATRCALSTLRAGGNRSGADSVMTSQAGFPVAVDFARGYPRYRPHDGNAWAHLAEENRASSGIADTGGAGGTVPGVRRTGLGTLDVRGANGGVAEVGQASGGAASVGTVAVLVLGAAARIPTEMLAAIAQVPCAVLGPRATESPLAFGVAAIDSGVAGIHEAGTALRMDDVPLPLRPSVDGPLGAAALIRQLRERVAVSLSRATRAPVPVT